MREIMVAGHICADLAPELPIGVGVVPGQLTHVGPLRIRPGGCVVNTGGDLAALGLRVSTSGAVGDDDLGAIVLARLDAMGIARQGIHVVADLGTSYSIVIEPPGMSRAFWHHVGASLAFDGTQVEPAGADILHVGYPPLLPSLLPQAGAPLARLLQRARSEGVTTSLDMAVVDPHSPVGRTDWHSLFRSALPLVDVFTPSLDDLQSSIAPSVAADRDGVRRLADEIIRSGVAILMITAGEDGVLLRTSDEPRFLCGGRLLGRLEPAWHGVDIWMPAAAVPRVATTNGAGDAATAGLLFGIACGYSPRDSAELAVRVAGAKVGGRELSTLGIPTPS